MSGQYIMLNWHHLQVSKNEVDLYKSHQIFIRI